MGSSGSKAARTAASTARKYPTRSPPTSAPSARPTNAPSTRPAAAASQGPTVHPPNHASTSRDNAIDLDSSDPDFAARLAQLGPVQPSPTHSNSSTFNRPSQTQAASSRSSPVSQTQFQPSASSPQQSIFPSPASNPAVALLRERSRLAGQAEEEFANVGRKGAAGREFLDVLTIRQVLMLRDEEGARGEDIEKRLGLAAGVVSRLGAKGVVSGAGMSAGGYDRN